MELPSTGSTENPGVLPAGSGTSDNPEQTSSSSNGQDFSEPRKRFTLLEHRRKCIFEPLYLSEVLGYDFHLVKHGFELIESVGPKIVPAENGHDPLPLADLDKTKNRLVLWSRGHFKTSAVVLKIVQLILAYPDIRILLMQGNLRNTRGLLREVKSHFDGTNSQSHLDRYFPNYCKKKRLGWADGFVSPARKRTHLKEATVTVASQKSVKAGQHYDAGFFDDLVNEINFRNQELQEKLIEDFNHYSPLVDPGGYKSVTGTRYSFGELYGYLIKRDAERREWAISIRDCWAGGKKENGPLFPRVVLEDGRTLGFTTEMLDALEKDDPATFSCQYLNRPLAAGSVLFTEEILVRHVRSLAADKMPALGPCCLFIDLAASKRVENDHSVIIAGRQDASKRMYVCDIRGDRFPSAHTFGMNVIDMATKHRPSRILIEGTAAGHYFLDYLQLLAGSMGLQLPLEPLKVDNTKDAKFLRISAIEGVLKRDLLWFLFGLPKWQELVEQFIEFPRGRHDDEIDTVSLMVKFYTQNTAVYQPRQIHTMQDEILKAPTLQTFIEQQSVSADDIITCGADFE